MVNLFYENADKEDDELITKIAKKVKREYKKFKNTTSGFDKNFFIEEWITDNIPDTKKLKKWYDERDESRTNYIDAALKLYIKDTLKDLGKVEIEDKGVLLYLGTAYLLRNFLEEVLEDEEDYW